MFSVKVKVFTAPSVPLEGDSPPREGSKPTPKSSPFQKGKGCNRPPVLRTALL